MGSVTANHPQPAAIHDIEPLSGWRRLLVRTAYLTAGVLSLVLALLGAVLPVLPTVPFLLLAAFCFGRGEPRFERWLLDHKTFGPPIRKWRESGAISRKGKIGATIGFAISIALSLIFAPFPWFFAPMAAAAVAGTWIWTRPEA